MTARYVARAAMLSIDPIDELASRHRAQAVDWVDSGAPLFRTASPATPPQHLVSYFVPVDVAGGSLLLEEHRRSGLWLPPGGHVDPGEDPAETARRECREELGIDAHFLPGIGARPLLVTITETNRDVHTDVSLWYAVELAQATALHIDQREMSSVRWLSFDEATALDPATTDPHLGRFVSALKAAFATLVP